MKFLYDIIIVLLLAFFAWRGAKKGLILSVCALAGIFIAFFGARFVSREFHQPVADIIEPPIYQSILGMEENSSKKAAVNPVEGYSAEELLEAIRDSGLYGGVISFLEDAVDTEALPEGSRSPVKAVSGYLAQIISKAALFAVTFLVIVLVWYLITKMLDLTFKLPGLKTLNWIGGMLIGLAKAVLLVVVLVWIAQLCDLIPTPAETPIVSFFTFKRLMALLNGLLA